MSFGSTLTLRSNVEKMDGEGVGLGTSVRVSWKNKILKKRGVTCPLFHTLHPFSSFQRLKSFK